MSEVTTPIHLGSALSGKNPQISRCRPVQYQSSRNSRRKPCAASLVTSKHEHAPRSRVARVAHVLAGTAVPA